MRYPVDGVEFDEGRLHKNNTTQSETPVRMCLENARRAVRETSEGERDMYMYACACEFAKKKRR